VNTLRWVLLRGGTLRAGWRWLGFTVITVVLGVLTLVLSALLYPLLPWSRSPTTDIAFQACAALTLFVITHGIAGAILDRPWTKQTVPRPRFLTSIGLGPVRRSLFEGLLGVGVGALVLTAVIAIISSAGASLSLARPFDGQVLLWSTIFLMAGTFEELAFRGYGFAWFGASIIGLTQLIAAAVLRREARATPRWPHALGWGVTVVLSAGLFGLAHQGNPSASALSFANTVLAGIWLGVAVVRTRTLSWAIGLHIGWNVSQALVWGSPVSGLSERSLGEPLPSLLRWSSPTPEWWSGGAYGLEGSIVTSVVLVAATLLAAHLPRRPVLQSVTGLCWAAGHDAGSSSMGR
jgi:membrane protease YdiL (CAAX protease family)